MKAVLAAVALIVLASCGRVESQSSLESAPPRISLGFQKDLRTVDGALTTLTIIQNDSQHSTVTITTLAGRSNVKKVNKLGDNFICKITPGFRFEIDCSVDLRPVDGALTVVTVVASGSNTFDASLRHQFFDRRTGKEVITTDDIGTGMSRMYIPQYHAL